MHRRANLLQHDSPQTIEFAKAVLAVVHTCCEHESREEQLSHHTRARQRRRTTWADPALQLWLRRALGPATRYQCLYKVTGATYEAPFDETQRYCNLRKGFVQHYGLYETRKLEDRMYAPLYTASRSTGIRSASS